MPVISTNTAANTAVRYLNNNSENYSDSLAKLASGSRITSASDDAAGLAISTRISSDVNALEQASTNASHGISILETADGGAANISDILERMKTLASQSASGTVTDDERVYIQAEFEELLEEVGGIAESTRYNGVSLLDGSSDFADDNIDNAAVLAADVGQTASISTTFTADDVISIDGDDTLEFDINVGGAGVVPVAIAAGATTGTNVDITGQQIVDAINAASTGATASFDDDGNMVIVTDNAAESLEIDIDVTDSSGSVGGVTFADFGAIDDLSGTALTAAGSGVLAANQFEVNDGETVSFDVNGTAVEITNGTGVAKSYTDQEIVDAINDALTADENDEVVAAVDATTGGITFTSSDTGATASVTVDNFSGTMTSGDALDASYLSLGDTDSDGAAKAFGSETEVSTTGSDIVVGSSSDDTINLRIESLTAEALGIDGLDISTQDGADAALDALDDAIDDVSKARAEMGAVMSRFEFRGEQIDTSIENLTAANSVLADVDIAKESAKASSYSVNVQASVSAAAQANQMPENLLQLIG
ncbi:hypothetical protein E1297_15810 [Roseibium sp. RKSG952]|nr:flagellin [Roseibium sp. RKSG952]MTH97460.1 hypothetical protein [Roseibium sp. RKSG952]